MDVLRDNSVSPYACLHAYRGVGRRLGGIYRGLYGCPLGWLRPSMRFFDDFGRGGAAHCGHLTATFLNRLSRLSRERRTR